MPVPHCLGYCIFAVNSKIKKCIYSKVILFQDCLGQFRSFNFHTNFRISSSISAKELGWHFDRYCVEPVDKFGDFCYQSTTKSPNTLIQDVLPFIYVLSVHFFQRYVLICSIWVFYFFSIINLFLFYSFWCYYRWNWFLNFIFRWFIATIHIYNYFHILIFYPTTMVNSHISSNRLLVDS